MKKILRVGAPSVKKVPQGGFVSQFNIFVFIRRSLRVMPFSSFLHLLFSGALGSIRPFLRERVHG